MAVADIAPCGCHRVSVLSSVYRSSRTLLELSDRTNEFT